jgi:hypothetical protein
MHRMQGEARQPQRPMPVCDDYPPGRANAFTGTLKFLRVDLGLDSHDHLLDPEIKSQLAMTRQ